MRSFYSFQYDKASCGVSVGVYEHKNPKYPDLRKKGILMVFSITQRQILLDSRQHRPNITQQYTEAIKKYTNFIILHKKSFLQA